MISVRRWVSPLPPRRVFLGALQKLAGVHVKYDKRVYDRNGRVLRKSTFYRFAVDLAGGAIDHRVDEGRQAGLKRAA